MKNNKNNKNKRSAKKSQKQKRSTQRVHAINGIPFIGGGVGGAFGFPDKIISKLRYHDVEPLTIAAGAIQKYVYRMNSTFDPDFTGVGHQPMFRDTYAALYDHYAVISAKATVKFVNTSAVAFSVGVLIDDDSTTSTLLDVLCEQSHGQHKLLPPLTGSLSSTTFTVNWDCKRILGIDPFTSELYKTSVGSNPTEDSNLTIWALSIDGSAVTCYFDIELEYTVLWTELSTPVES